MKSIKERWNAWKHQSWLILLLGLGPTKCALDDYSKAKAVQAEIHEKESK
nr:hypothetical protein F987_00301 [Acinetobacter gyllenbergii NIPH 230]